MGRWVTTSTFRPGSHQSKVGPLPAAPTLNLLQEGQQRPRALQLLPWHPLFRWGELLQSLGQEGRWKCLPWASSMGWWTWTCSPMKGTFREHHRGASNNVHCLKKKTCTLFASKQTMYMPSSQEKSMVHQWSPSLHRNKSSWIICLFIYLLKNKEWKRKKKKVKKGHS